METYYINASANYTESRYPYDDYRWGAKSFTQLFEDPLFRLQDGDSIVVFCPADDVSDVDEYIVDESGRTTEIDIKKSVTISTFNPNSSRINAKIICPNNTQLFRFYKYSENSTVSNLSFYKTIMTPGAAIRVYSCLGVSISNCDFDFGSAYQTTSFSNWLYFDSCFSSTVDGCSFKVPANDLGANQNTAATGIIFADCYDCDISNNTFDMSSGVAKSVSCVTCSNLRIYSNVIHSIANPNGTTPLPGDYFRVIELNNSDMLDVNSNAINGLVDGYCGIMSINSTATDMNQHIRNNVVITEDGESIAGISTRGDSSSYILIYDNIVMSMDSTTYTKAFDVRVKNNYGIVDYNNIYNIQQVNEFVYDGNPANLSAIGSHTLRENPNLPIQTSGDSSIWSNYVPEETSLTKGMGSEYTNIGPLSHSISYSVVDTVLAGSLVPSYVGFANYGNHINCAMEIGESEAASTWFVNDATNSFYENQFGWENVASPYPFTSDSPLYKQNDKYIVQHRDLLYPFDNITCPANPGRGKVDGYPEYETGLFGYPRNLWKNGCEADPCIIQDTVMNVAAWQTTNENIYTVQNTVDICSTTTIE